MTERKRAVPLVNSKTALENDPIFTRAGSHLFYGTTLYDISCGDGKTGLLYTQQIEVQPVPNRCYCKKLSKRLAWEKRGGINLVDLAE